MHMKAIHGPKPKRAAKRMSNFTPVAKQTKKSKTGDEMINSEGIIEVDDSIILMDDSFSGRHTSIKPSVSLLDIDSPVQPKP